MKRICVACGSNPGQNPRYLDAASGLGRALAERNIGLVYGGARVGLMGQIADAARSAGGEVIGIITSDLASKVGHEALQDLEVVASMHERKQRFSALSDGYIALPGGFGTFEEILEAVTWNQLRIHQCATGLLNVDGFFDRLIDFVRHAGVEGFIRQPHVESLLVSDDPHDLLDTMASFEPPTVEKWLMR